MRAPDSKFRPDMGFLDTDWVIQSMRPPGEPMPRAVAPIRRFSDTVRDSIIDPTHTEPDKLRESDSNDLIALRILVACAAGVIAFAALAVVVVASGAHL